MRASRVGGAGHRRVPAVVMAVVFDLVAQLLDLLHRHRGHELQEEQEQRREEADGAGEQADVHPGRGVDAPAGGQEVPVQRGDDDDEALAPHADVDQQRGHPDDGQVGAGLLEPEDLRDDDVADDHQPVDRA